jgi:hypothetical protein
MLEPDLPKFTFHEWLNWLGITVVEELPCVTT